MEDIGLSGERKPVAYFKGIEQGLVLNKTNLRKIAEMHGEETNDWRGKDIILYDAMVDFKGETVQAVRVRAPLSTGRETAIKTEPPEQPPWEPTPSIITEGESMAKLGIARFRDWRDRLSAEENIKLRTELDKLLALAHQVSDV